MRNLGCTPTKHNASILPLRSSYLGNAVHVVSRCKHIQHACFITTSSVVDSVAETVLRVRPFGAQSKSEGHWCVCRMKPTDTRPKNTSRWPKYLIAVSCFAYSLYNIMKLSWCLCSAIVPDNALMSRTIREPLDVLLKVRHARLDNKSVFILRLMRPGNRCNGYASCCTTSLIGYIIKLLFPKYLYLIYQLSENYDPRSQ